MLPKTYFPRSFFSGGYYGDIRPNTPPPTSDLLRLIGLVEQLIAEIRKTLNVTK